jgi:sugar phosphate isomerase/epimerase
MIPSIWTGFHGTELLPEAFRALHACGWRTFEIASEHLVAIDQDDDPKARIEEARKCLEELGDKALQAHGLLAADVAGLSAGDRTRDIDTLERHTEIAAALGVRTMVMHPGGRNLVNSDAEFAEARRLNVAAFRRIGDFAAERGLRVGLENLMRRGASTPTDMLELLGAIDHPAIGITFDSSHARVAALDIPAALRAFGPHLLATHISDNNGSGDQHLLPGGGNIEWRPLMEAFRDTGYSGMLNFEIPGERHPDPELHAMKARYALEVARWLIGIAHEKPLPKEAE